jgi:hypothetical protein
MKIIYIHAVYEGSPVSLVVETDTGAILELSLKELKEIEGSLEKYVWKQLTEDYKVFYTNSP